MKDADDEWDGEPGPFAKQLMARGEPNPLSGPVCAFCWGPVPCPTHTTQWIEQHLKENPWKVPLLEKLGE